MDFSQNGCLIFRESGTQAFVYSSCGKFFLKGVVHIILQDFVSMLTIIWLIVQLYDKLTKKK